MSFTAKQDLLEPAFESYKLANDDTAQETHQLPSPAAVHTGGAALGFLEVKERSLHNALVPAKAASEPSSAVAAYIDASGGLVVVSFGDKPSFDSVHTLSVNGTITPSLASIEANVWVASVGGAPELIKVHNGAKEWTRLLDIPLAEADAPWTVVRADMNGDDALILVQRARRQGKETRFDVALLRTKLTQTASVHLAWHVVGSEPVVYANAGKVYTLGAEAQFTRDGEGAMPPYTWSQTADGVNVCFTLSSSVQKKEIHVEFTPECVYVRLDPTPTFTEAGGDDEKHLAAENRIRAGDYIGRHLWDSIDAAGSKWTFSHVSSDKHAAVHLALHLVKSRHAQHWKAVFKDGEQVKESTSATPEADKGATQADPAMDKYTSDEPKEHSTAGVGSKTSLLQDGLEEEDARGGSVLQITHVIGDNVYTTRDEHTTLLARPIPTHGTDNYVLVKRDMDGLVFRQRGDDWEHTETLPGVAYVLASKRDAHPIYVYGEKQPATVLAIEAVRHDAAAGMTNAGNIYAYKVTQAKSGTSHVLRIGGTGLDPSNSLGTVQGAAVVGAQPVLAVLCEHALVTISGIL